MDGIRALLVAAMMGSAGVVTAQTPPSNTGNQASESPKVPGQTGVEEPTAHPAPAPRADAGVFVNGRLNVPAAPADTSTTPAKFSATNGRLDRIPLMARGPQLTDAQRQLILDRVLRAGSSAPSGVAANPSEELPAGVPMEAWPADVVQQIPAIHDTKFVKLADKILVVRPENRIVIGEIGR
jgi:hypothetical protein